MAEDLRQKFDDGLAYAALSTWKRTSKRLPAIAFFGKSLKREAWRKWRAALPEARRLRHAAKAGDERMMSECRLMRSHFVHAKREIQATCCSSGSWPIELESLEESQRELTRLIAPVCLLSNISLQTLTGWSRPLAYAA